MGSLCKFLGATLEILDLFVKKSVNGFNFFDDQILATFLYVEIIVDFSEQHREPFSLENGATVKTQPSVE